MTDKRNPAVQALMERALNQTDPVALLRHAAEMTKAKSGWKGRRTLPRDQAEAATRRVTEMLSRYGLKPTVVLRSGGHAHDASATTRFYLSRAEMEKGVSKDRRFAGRIGAYVDSVKAVARHAGEAGHQVEEVALLAELAEVTAAFLEQFREAQEHDSDAEIASDVNLVAAWLASPRRGYELARFLSEAGRRQIAFDASESSMGYVGEMAFLDDGNEPVVPLFTRVVGSAEAEIYHAVEQEPPRDGEGVVLAGWRPVLDRVGKSRCVVCQRIGLGVRLAPGGQGHLEMVFTLDPVTYLGEPGGMSDKPGGLIWAGLGEGAFLATPRYPDPGVRGWLHDEGYWWEVAAMGRYDCPRFEALHRRLLDSEHPHDEFGLQLRMHLPVTPENCEFLLAGENGGGHFMWRVMAGVDEGSVLPEEVTDDAGVVSRLLRDRLAALVYVEGEPSLAGLLHIEAERRTDALEDFLLRSATGSRRRKLEFRARMRR